MPVPWEMLIPFGLITGLLSVTSVGMNVLRRWDNDWKPTRHTLDAWDYQMMERDRRLTGDRRGQRDDPIAPKTFATNSIFDKKKL